MKNKTKTYDHILIGKIGEKIAANHLSMSGYKLLKRNHREKHGEIDIIAIEPFGALVFFEVKTMGYFVSGKNLSPEDNLTKLKLKKLKIICSLFAAKHQKIINPKIGWRIDLLAISINNSEFTIHHYKNIVTG